jgi:hypothetical protein
METIQDVKSKMDQVNPEKKEGPVATAIEEQTAKIPSDIYLWASFGIMAVSLGLKIMKRDTASNFIGMWAQSFLLFGIYNKLVKQLGHDSGNAY